MSDKPKETLIETIQRALSDFDSSHNRKEINENGEKVLDNAFVWLRALLEDNERIKRDRDAIQSTLMEVESAKLQIHKQWWEVRGELEQIKESRDKWEQGYNRKTLRCIDAEAEVENLLSELAAKDRVLEWYADEAEGAAKYILGDRARSILSQYKEKQHVPITPDKESRS